MFLSAQIENTLMTELLLAKLILKWSLIAFDARAQILVGDFCCSKLSELEGGREVPVLAPMCITELCAFVVSLGYISKATEV